VVKTVLDPQFYCMSLLRVIGTNVRRYRLRAGLSQDRLAEAAALHRTYVGGIERGERNVSALNIAKLAAALGVEPHQLLMPAEPDD
jgi:transcriptional regulator with XRE-family HTH domain